MRDVLAAIVPFATVVFAVSSMLAVGMGNSWEGIVGPLRHWPRVIRALAANFILAPALAYLLVRVLGLDLSLGIGLFLVGSAAGSAFVIKLAQAAAADVSFAASLLVLLLPLTVVFLPIIIPFALPDAEVSATAIATPLVYSMLLPLGAGLLLRPRVPGFARRASPLLGRLSTVALVVLVASIVGANWQAILGLGERAILGVVAFVVGTFAIGWTLGGRQRETREVVALGTAQRNIAAATVVATQTFGTMPGVVIMVTAISLVGMLVLFPIAFFMRRQPVAARRLRLLRRREA